MNEFLMRGELVGIRPVTSAVFDARPALETIKQLDFIRVCGSEGEARAMDVIAEGLSALGVEWWYHDFEDWWIEAIDPHLELRGRKLPVRPVLEPSFLRESHRLPVDVRGALAPVDDCDGRIAVCLDRESLVDSPAVARLLAFELEPEMESCLWAQEGRADHVPTAYLRTEDIPLIRSAVGEQAALRWGLNRVQRQFRNIVAEFSGTSRPSECVVMGAHIDSWPGTVGASDNAAGCAILLEAAKWFGKHPPDRTVRLVWFTGEEIDARGSRAYVRGCIEDVSLVKLMVNVDSTCELDTGPFGLAASDEQTVDWARGHLDLDGMEHSLSQCKGIDAGAFVEQGIRALGFEAPCKPSAWDAHQPDDRPETIDPHKLQFLGSVSLEAAIHAADTEVRK